jgi:hypothetical protein
MSLDELNFFRLNARYGGRKILRYGGHSSELLRSFVFRKVGVEKGGILDSDLGLYSF